MNVKGILLFVGGFAVGGVTGVLGTKKYFHDKYQSYYEEDRDYLENYYNKTEDYKHEKTEDSDDSPKEETSQPGGRMTPEERASVREKLRRNYEETTNYAAMYRGQRAKIDPVDDPAELEHPEEEVTKICKICGAYEKDNPEKCSGFCHTCNEMVNDEDSCDDWIPMEESDSTFEEQAFEDHQKNKNKPPKIISAEAYSNLPAHIDQQVLYFYVYDEVLCDENEEMIDEPGLIVGDALTKYDFADSDERCIFVMNYSTDTCYEIQKVDASWTDSH